MGAITNTLTTYDTVGIREDLSEVISNIDPIETPFVSNAGKGDKPDQTFYEWQLDSLNAVDTTNARAEGNDHTSFTAAEPTVRVGNYCQISDKDLIISGTQEVVRKAGRKSDTSRYVAKRGVELRRDIEAICLQRNTGATGTDPRRTAVMLSYVQSNTDFGATGADPAAPAPTYAGNRTDGTLRTVDEATFKGLLATMFSAGAKIAGATFMVGPQMKQKVSTTFTGIATLYKDVAKGAATVVGAVDVYVSDFGQLSIVPNRFQRERDGWVLDFGLIRLRDLRPYQVIDLAKTGDANKKLMLREWSLQVDNEKGLGLYADIQTT